MGRKTPSIHVIEGCVAEALLTDSNTVTGLLARMTKDASPVTFRSRAIVLATGGVGHLYAVTTNPFEASGLGMAIAARAGAVRSRRLVGLERVRIRRKVVVPRP